MSARVESPQWAPVWPSLKPYAATLAALAEAAIDHGLAHAREPEVDSAQLPAALQVVRPAFVTLLAETGALRGCMGSLETDQPLAVEVSDKAFAAAFRDPRFAPLTAAERPGIQCKLSVLTPPEPLRFRDEADLLAQLRPGVDGLVLSADEAEATFLPAVWQQLPEPVDFWRMLKRKAGLPDDAFPQQLAVYRYTAEDLSDA